MATIKRPAPELYGTALDVFATADSWRTSAHEVMSKLIEHLTPEEAGDLPHAISGVLPLLRSRPDRLRFAVEIATRFDLFETAEAVAAIALGTGDHELILNAADLAATAPSGEARSTLVGMVDRYPDLQRSLEVRLDPNSVPRTRDEERLYNLCWPGNRTTPPRFPQPPVAVVDVTLRSDCALQLALSLDRIGATVRRLNTDVEVPFWFGAETVLVCRESTSRRVRACYPQFPETQIVTPAGDDLPTAPGDHERLLRRVAAALPGRFRLAPSESSPDMTVPLWAPEFFTAGVYSTREAAFLAGTKTSSLMYLRKRNLLRPHDNGVLRWNFRDVAAVRTWMFLKANSRRRVSAKVVGALASFEGASDAVRLGVTVDGHVMVDNGNGFEDVLTGQRALDLPVRDVDSAFRPFTYGANRVPDLLRATTNSALHPACLHGTPHLNGHRISAKDLASLHQTGGAEAVIDAYPELETVTFDDVVSVGHQLLALV